MIFQTPVRSLRAIARRIIRRRAYWVLVLAVLTSIYLGRAWNASRPISIPPAIVLPTAPPLAYKVVHARYDKLPLSKVFDDLSSQLGVPFSVDWPALKELSLEPATPVTLSPDQPLPFKDALVLLGSSKILSDLTTNPVVVSTESEIFAPKRFVKIIYSIADLNHVVTPDIYTDAEPWSRGRDMASLITRVIDSPQWASNGGLSMITDHDQTLIIDAAPCTHYQVQQFLNALRKK